MRNNRINPIEATNGVTFKKKKESTQEDFIKKLKYAQRKYNEDNSDSRKR